MPEPPALQFLIVPVTPFAQNCSIIWCTETRAAAVVDPGGEIDRLIGIAATHTLHIEKILITHGHLDHAGAAGELAERVGVPIEGPHREDKFWIDALAAQGANYGMRWCQPFVPDRWLEGGDTVTLGAQRLQVLHCPGHTPGHIVFFHDGARLAFVGDVLFRGSIGRTDFPRGDHAALLDAITTRLWPLGDDIRFVPGHGPISTFGEERRSNPFVADCVLSPRRS
jgi:hydroxyacylglutathione hydrolase